MSREIKFRAWDDGEGLMWYSDGTPDAMGDRVESMERFWYLIARYSPELMQYTGIKDRDGTEIYEGDILRHRMNNSATGVVEYDGNMGAFRVRHVTTPGDGEYGKHISWFMTTAPIGEYVSNDVTAKARVIGNIHENPELA